jgi:ESS family glutamate:Na+ symporter
MREYLVEPLDGLILAILVLFLGTLLTKRVRILEQYFIPPAVTGGIIISAIIAGIDYFADLKITFDLQIRDILLLTFFSTIGLSAKFGQLIAGGKALAILVLIAGCFLIVQDITGITIAVLLGGHPGYGLMAGSVSFAGGHGTAIAWGQVAEESGLVGAEELGIAFATFGLIAGGLIGGPIAGRLIAKYRLQPENSDQTSKANKDSDAWTADVRLNETLTTILLLSVCVEIGSLVNRVLFAQGVLLPGFLTSLFVGIVLTNLSDVFKFRLNIASIARFGEISLGIFLAMSMMSMQLLVLSKAMGPIMIIVLAQTLLITVFAMFLVFRLMGRDYDACVICAGFAGLGLGATPVAIANMSAITSRFGHSAKAFLVVPLVGAFFIDIMNAVVIKFFIKTIASFTG